ncbi:carboxymuconolactone decarboxylase [Paractinoplanes abujensis]|uniref:Putative peroxidase-related enzyme n=1 Tax=Paractinoplanes abujensis TaxID=882441 RepID=A0A7W7FZ26_9ACTN|nr:carboxymuconolactone decarboxylase family protein [Actinoplanes abujensis]MBB4691628.1 putative peroxidase-related enzyme [Actinoplanes abujensis]GID16953.1 carboxymuconolactone decarboxylase [Actinoplanes abujensis]
MAYIDLGVDETREPGIRGLLRYRPSTGKPLSDLAEALLRGDSPLTRGEREYIAAYVSSLNDCAYCTGSHGAVAAAEGMPADAPVTDKLRSLLAVASATASGGHAVTPALIADARSTGATDLEIHDTVLIAAAFSMFNRYVDGLGTTAPDNPRAYELGAAHIVKRGYLPPS